MIDKTPANYICFDCGEISDIVPSGTLGRERCRKCFAPLRLNPYTGLAQLGIDYFSYSGPGGWKTMEIFRIAKTMVFLLEKKLIQEFKVKSMEEPVSLKEVEDATSM